MVSLKTRRFAAPVIVACAGMLGSAATAHAAGGLSVTPASLEHRAKVGTVGSLTLNNTTNDTLKVTVVVRPWMQQLNGTVLIDMRTTLSRYVRPSSSAFTVRAHTRRPVSLRMLRHTRSGSLFGAIEVVGKPVNTKGRKGIIPNYRLISKVRLQPRRKSLKWRTGAAQIRQGAIILPVRNLGNSIDPIGGTFTISGPTRRSGAMRAIAALPGKLVGLNLGSTRGLRNGHYTITARVTQAGRSAIARTGFTVR